MDEKKSPAEPGWENIGVGLTVKGLALLAMVKAGTLEPDEDGCYRTTEFENFWEKFAEGLSSHGYEIYYAGSVLGNHAEDKTKNDKKYLKKSILALFGFVCGVLFAKLLLKL